MQAVQEALQQDAPADAAAPPQTPSPPPPPLTTQSCVTAVNAADFLALKLPPRQALLKPWLPAKGLAMTHAPRGLGKTHLALGVAWAIATGGRFLKWTAPQPRRVLYIDGEMPAAALQERLSRISRTTGSENRLEAQFFKLAAADLCRDGLPDLADPDAQGFYQDVVGDADLVILDNLSTLCRLSRESDADSWLPVQSWALALRRAGKSVLLVHHAGKSGQQRGTSRKEDVLDTVIALRRPPEYKPEDGARFEVHFEKSRGFHGADAEPFEARLIDHIYFGPRAAEGGSSSGAPSPRPPIKSEAGSQEGAPTSGAPVSKDGSTKDGATASSRGGGEAAVSSDPSQAETTTIKGGFGSYQVGGWLVSPVACDDDLVILRRMRDAGISIREIARRAGVPKSTVARRLGEKIENDDIFSW